MNNRAVPPSLPDGTPDWSKMTGKPAGRSVTEAEVMEEARDFYASYASPPEA